MVDLLLELVKSLLIIFPAYAANGFPPLARGSLPIDFKRKWSDGNRILGDGKTIEGLSIGIIAGTFVGVIESMVQPQINSYASAFGMQIPAMSFSVALMISLGTLFGDICGSFIKRRLKLQRGKEVLFLDQWNFIIGSILFIFLLTPITVWMVIIMLLITLVVHRLANIAGHKLKVKREPW
ncbi:MAG: CDP-2,3-bis-(O-geranylgeranyl)-sn-glycerol synthase [Candidatus Aenigmatarchaeota archaeon]